MIFGIGELKRGIENDRRRIHELETALLKSEAERDKLQAELQTVKDLCGKLEKYAAHRPNCPAKIQSLAAHQNRLCDCGLSELQQQAREMRK